MKYKTCTDYWLNTQNMTFRGEFEEMYADIDDPWDCTKTSNSLNNRLFLEVLFYERKYRKILDVGCGLGSMTYTYFSRNGGGYVAGYDISSTAISRASRAFSEIKFFVKNILTDKIEERYDLIILSEVLWYILNGVKDIFLKLYNALSKNGIIGVHQYFPKEQRFGKEIIDGIEGFEEFIMKDTDFLMKEKILCYGEYEGQVLLALLNKKQ
jgi:SAM-dependent methyltransferase